MRYTFSTVVALTLLLILSVGAYAYFVRLRNSTPASYATSTEGYVCNSDGKLCPDGSVVGRSGPTCEFTACPGVVPVGTTTQQHGMAILYGRVVTSPTCPVETNPPTPGCEPKGYVTEVTAIDDLTGTDVGARTTTTSSGSFIMDLVPGEYRIHVLSKAVYPRCADTYVKVYANATSSITISCDSGIR